MNIFRSLLIIELVYSYYIGLSRYNCRYSLDVKGFRDNVDDAEIFYSFIADKVEQQQKINSYPIFIQYSNE